MTRLRPQAEKSGFHPGRQYASVSTRELSDSRFQTEVSSRAAAAY